MITVRCVKLIFFKPSGKYFTSEINVYKRNLHLYQIIDDIKENEDSYKGMHIVLEFDKDDDIGCPCMILAQDRNKLNQ